MPPEAFLGGRWMPQTLPGCRPGLVRGRDGANTVQRRFSGKDSAGQVRPRGGRARHSARWLRGESRFTRC